ncbi:MFS transporter [Rossellomorea aquimaris]|uniref:MFS transporter n=1 Tax=Rossellomorea aquimaris TaxID=189382 RepID=UPI001CD7D442|nr:MFS transporter [Rossellomorea aquimaris]MCA1054944.1 MFS transporter [Rossellomorea aquimaris]
MKSRSFRLLWLGQTCANFGDILYLVGLISILYSISESVVYLALVPFLSTMGRFTSGMISPLLLNRYKLKTLLLNAQAAKTLIILILAIFSQTSQDTLFTYFTLFVLLTSFLDGWAGPATQSMLPRLVKEEEIFKANNFVYLLMDSIQLGGWAIGGILVAQMGGTSVIWITFTLYLLSTLLMSGIIDRSPFEKKTSENKVASLISDWKIIWKTPLVRSIHIVLFLESVANVVWIAAILYVFVEEVLHASEAWWGYLNTTFFIGIIVGGLLCARYNQFIENHMKKVLMISAFGVSIVAILFGQNSIGWIALCLSIMSGFLEQLKSITLNTYLQKNATSHDLPKIYSIQSAMTSLLFGCSTLLYGMLTEMFSVTFVFTLSGCLLAISFLYILMNHSSLQLSIPLRESQKAAE